MQHLNWTLAYSFVDATFEDNFKVLSPNHAFADDEGQILVENGDQIPGIPQNQFKLLTNYRVTDLFGIGLDVISNSDQYLRGDESNQLNTVAGYTLVNLRARYQFSDQFEIFATINNLLGPAPPRAAFLGLRYTFQ